MKIITLSSLAAIVFLTLSCGPTYLATTCPEESVLTLVKITDEANSRIVGNGSSAKGSLKAPNQGICTSEGFGWNTERLLAVSPDGTEIAYQSLVDGRWNIMVRKSSAQSAATQRTFRSVGDFTWGEDGKLYFGDIVSGNRIQICVTDAHKGSLMRQITSNNVDYNPILSNDRKKLFFTRIDDSGAFIWSYDLGDGSLTSCCRGYNAYPLGEGSDEFICVRNSTFGNSELWRVNYEKGIETLILSDKKRGFTNPVVSPDGQWIVCQGNNRSSISNKNNLDIFVVRIDGSDFMQLTFHPADDCCPVWSPDGKEIYFLSRRANNEGLFNIWKMKFEL